MEQMEKPTTSVNYGLNVTSSEVDEFLRDAFRGRAEIHDRLANLPLKPLATPVKETVEPTKSHYEVPGLIDDESDTDDYETSWDTEVKKSLGRGVLSRMIKGADKWIAYGTGLAISKLPGTKSMQEREAYQQELNEKYANKDGDSWFRRRINAINRNRLNIRDRVPVYGIGAVALARFGVPYALDLGTHTAHDMSEWLNQPRTLTLGQDLAANAIDYTPVEHDMQPTVYVMGGHTQGNAVESGYVDSLYQSGVITADEKVVPVNWSAQMGPLPGDTMPMNVSDAEGGRQVADLINDAGGAPVKFVFFSQSTEAGLQGLNEIANQPGNNGRLPDNVEVILQGTPSGKFGMSNNNLVGAVNPLLGAMGFEIDQPIPEGNITVRTHVNDVFGNSADQSGSFTGLMAISPGHQVVDENNAVLLYTYQEGSTKYEVWGSPSGMNHPVSQLLEANGMPVSPELDNLFEAAVPRTPHGEETRYTDVHQASDALGAYLNSTTGNTGIASNVVDSVMTPERTNDLQNMTDLQKIPDQFAEMANDPSKIPENSQAIHQEVSEAIQTGVEYLNPGKWIEAANDGLRGAGIPFQLPEQAPVAPPPAPAPAPAPIPALPDFSQPLQQVNDLVGQFGQFLQGFQPPR